MIFYSMNQLEDPNIYNVTEETILLEYKNKKTHIKDGFASNVYLGSVL